MEGNINPRLNTELLIRKRCNNINGSSMEIDTSSPERSPIWMEPKPRKKKITPPNKKAAVLYYLSRNGHLDHPHLIQVPLPGPPTPQALLYLRDVMSSLNMHRGKGMANMYSWSFKRSYKNGYVWHDVSEDDLIHSTNGHDYILKGTLLVQTSSPDDSRSHETNSSTQTPPPPDAITSGEDSNSPAAIRRVRNQSWSSFDNPQEYVVHYKCESNRELAAKFAADAATQTTDDQEWRRRKECAGQSVEISREEIMISPPQLNSSEDGSSDSVRDVDHRDGEMRDRTVVKDRFPSGRMKASKVWMQLISCGSVSVNDEVMRSKQESDFVENN